MKFSDYLIKQFQNNYQGWDDSWPDAENKWYSELSDSTLIEEYCNYMWDIAEIDITGWCFPHEKTLKFIHSLL